MNRATPTLTFVVEEAGCESCAARVGSALAPLLEIREIAVDAETDRATVTASADEPVSKIVVDAALREASGSGHTYRLAPDSWRTVP